MPDLIDMACEREQMDRDIALAAASHSAPVLPPTGYCYNCQEPLPDGLRFCDNECRDDHDRRCRSITRHVSPRSPCRVIA